LSYESAVIYFNTLLRDVVDA